MSDVLVAGPVDEAMSRLPSSISGRGWLVPIGGRMTDPAIVTRFLALCGGPAAHIAILPTASNEPDAREYYETLFGRFDVGSVDVLPVHARVDANDPALLARLATATGIFFTGGNQLKLVTLLGGTPMAALLRSRFAAGVHVAGTSAGAACLSTQMIAFGEEGKLPRAAMVTTVAGLGLTDRFIIDQHFRERDRLGRLVTAVAYNPIFIGLGVDEDTGAFISPDDVMHVVGSGSVTIVDPFHLDSTDLLEALPGTPVELPGMTVHVMPAGTVCDLDDLTSQSSSADRASSSSHADARPS